MKGSTSIIKTIEGTVASVPLKVVENIRNKSFSKGHIKYSFICGGAFAGLDKVIRNRSEKGGIGYASKVRMNEVILATYCKL